MLMDTITHCFRLSIKLWKRGLSVQMHAKSLYLHPQQKS
ncbi:hypothetical protein Gorai_013620 [Gossypium raimondii]|uniref:Uncharacterized protein n=1 Tax=Gossypium raimondii TaxID=29730 RepID=A0A7J8Q655_GOSRA|nr:hypothetical protein [Gossypium raimondii]